MRVEPYSVDSIIHVTKRGARGMRITRSIRDQERFVHMLYYLNSEHQPDHWDREVWHPERFEWPRHWKARVPLVRVLAWTLMPNHFHLLLQETREGGVSKFMQRLCGSMSKHFNTKYEEAGSLFQSSFKSRTVSSDRYLRWCAPYILVKNPFELYPGGLRGATENFERAWSWALTYRFSSLPVYGASRRSPIIETENNILHEMFETSATFKKASREMIEGRAWEDDDELEALALEG
ncbi:MAG: transposase [Patescibacteria group bacterium]